MGIKIFVMNTMVSGLQEKLVRLKYVRPVFIIFDPSNKAVHHFLSYKNSKSPYFVT